MINNSVKKCILCNNENIGEFIIINDKKYHLCCIEDLQKQNTELKEEKKRLLEIAKKMHLYIFLNITNEQKAYDEIGLTDEENAILGYSGEFVLKEVE